MTYADDTAADFHRVGFYIRFRGIPTRISTHDPANHANWNPSETFAATLVGDSLSGFRETLARESSVVEQGGFTFEVMATDAMVSLFRRRGGTEDLLNGSVTAGGTTLTVVDNLAPTSGVAYLDRETVNITGFSGSDRTVTRGYEDSVAVPHATGAVLSDVPRFWYTRRFTVFAVYLDTGTETELYTGSLDKSPEFRDGRFSFSGIGVINSYLMRPLHTGFRPVESSGPAVVDGNALDIPFDSTSGLLSPGYYRISGSSGEVIAGGFQLGLTPTVTATEVSIPAVSYVSGTVPSLLDLAGDKLTLEQVTVPVGTPGEIAQQVMVSVEGDQTNGYWDWLVGERADVSGSDELHRDLRMGAGIPAADIDTATFNTIVTDYEVATWLDEEITLGEFLTSEVLFRAGGYVYVTPAGVLTFKEYTSNAIRAGLTAYTTADVLTSSVLATDDETGGIGRVVFQCNYRPSTREFLRSIELVFRDDRALYGDVGASLSKRSKSINVAASGEGIEMPWLFTTSTDLTEIESTFDRQRARQSWAGRRMALRLPWRLHNTFTVGYRFSWSDDRMIDHEGGSSVSGRYYEVTGRTLDMGTGEVAVECDEVPSGTLLCPSAFVSSWDGGTITATLDTSTDLHDSAPGSDFAQTWMATFYDASVNFTVSDTVVVKSVTSSTIEFNSAPSLSGGAGPAAGDLIVLAQSDDTTYTNDVSADVEDFAFAADASYTVGASSNTGPRWS